MTIQSITFAVFAVCVISFVKCEYDCLQRESTWSTKGQIELLAHVSLQEWWVSSALFLVYCFFSSSFTFQFNKFSYSHICKWNFSSKD